MERIEVPDDRAPLAEWLVYLMHDASYRWTEPHVRGRRVLDLGCGTGYGAASLGGVAAEVVAVDVSAEAIAYAQRAHAESGVRYHRVDDPSRHALPYPDGSFDAVVSFQVLEHLDRPAAYLHEAARLLAPGGVLLLATPDRETRLAPRQKPWNRFHVTEYDGAGLRDLLAPHFASSEVLGMTLAPQHVGVELARVRQARRAARPFTFPAAPEAWRRAGLGAMTWAVAQAPKRRPAPPPAAERPGPEVVMIGPDASPRLFLLAVGRTAAQPGATRA